MSEIIQPPVPPIVVACHSEPRHPGIARLTKSLDKWGWTYRINHVENWRGFDSKLSGAHVLLPELHEAGHSHILFTDAFDTVALGPPEEVVKYMTSGMLIGCEKCCWPEPGLASRYPVEHKSPWRYVNSGGYLASIKFLYDVLLNGTGDDQLWLTNKYLQDQDHIKLDDGCKVFQTIGHTVLPWAPWYDTFAVGNDKRLTNRITGSKPVFMHGNGRTPMKWLDELGLL